MSLFGTTSSFGQSSNVFGSTTPAANTNPMKDFEVRKGLCWADMYGVDGANNIDKYILKWFVGEK